MPSIIATAARVVRVQVYMMSYHESLEVAQFQQAAAREKQSFIDLIHKKRHLVLPTNAVRLLFLCRAEGVQRCFGVFQFGRAHREVAGHHALPAAMQQPHGGAYVRRQGSSSRSVGPTQSWCARSS